jgi:hypothetical protein
MMGNEPDAMSSGLIVFKEIFTSLTFDCYSPYAEIGINQIFTPSNHGRIQTLSLNHVSQRSNDSNPLRENADL